MVHRVTVMTMSIVFLFKDLEQVVVGEGQRGVAAGRGGWEWM